jgi:4-amino-4-deoxy-L-arabinose transferase-like glycosyltransferase
VARDSELLTPARERTARRVLPIVGALLAAGLALRVWFLLSVTGDSSLVGDGAEYVGLGEAIADGHGYVNPFLLAAGQDGVATAHKPPLYPLLLAAVSALAGSGHVVAYQVASALVGTATVAVCALLAHRIAGPRAAVLAAAAGAVYPVFLVADASLRAETLYGLLVALALLAAYRAWERPTAWRLAQLGAVIGLATLARTEGLLLLALLGAPLVWRRAGAGRLLKLVALTAACALTLAPWLIRCWIVFDEPVAISTSYGDLIAGANCDATYHGDNLGGWAFECVTGASGANEAVVARRLRARGLRYARGHTERLPAVVAARALRPWGFYDPAGEASRKTLGEGRSVTANWFGLAACWTLMLLAIPAFLILRRREQPLFILLAPFVLVLVVSVTSYGILRFRAPADVALVVLAAVTLDALLGGRVQAPRSAESATS